MSNKRKNIRERLAAGEVLIGFSLGFPTPGIIELAGGEWDWFWIDGQHGAFNYNELLDAVRAAEIVGVPPILRLPGHDYSIIGPALDLGAAGLLVPMVETAEQAEAIVQAVRFPPLGKRSYGARRLFDMHGPLYYEHANDEVLLMVQIETVEGLENCEKIAAVEGVDALFVGPSDLRLSMGKHITTPLSDPALQEAFDRVAAACKAHGKHPATVGATMDVIEDLAGRGYQLMVRGRDSEILHAGVDAALAEVREFRKKWGK
jgi:2-keto-3-deoxy-L-rhamnonate aldolase RhmA